MREPSREDLSLLTIDEAARIAGVQPWTVRSWIRRRGLTVWRRPGRPTLLSEIEVLEAERAARTSKLGGRPRKATPPPAAGS